MIHCHECGAISTTHEPAITLGANPGVCPKCYSENWMRVRNADDALDAMLADIRRATTVREFVLGGFAR